MEGRGAGPCSAQWERTGESHWDVRLWTSCEGVPLGLASVGLPTSQPRNEISLVEMY